MFLKTVLLIPYDGFKEKIKITKEYDSRGYYVEAWDKYIFCYKDKATIRKKNEKK